VVGRDFERRAPRGPAAAVPGAQPDRGGDIPAGTEATANECWDTSFEAVYWYDSIGYYEATGTEDLCVYAEASYALTLRH